MLVKTYAKHTPRFTVDHINSFTTFEFTLKIVNNTFKTPPPTEEKNVIPPRQIPVYASDSNCYCLRHLVNNSRLDVT